MKFLEFEKDKGHIIVEEDYITFFDNKNYNRRKIFPMYRVKENNIKVLHDVLKMANLGGYLLTEEALVKFDLIVESWEL